jgi:3-oxoadipate enol-lactonase
MSRVAQKSSDGAAMTPAYFDAGDGLPLVLLHAFPFSHTMWQPQFDALARVTRFIAPDLPGFGAATRTVPTIDAMADVVAEFLLARCGQTPVVLGGCSMGGYVALALARKYPERLHGLILIDTRAEADPPATKETRTKNADALGAGTLTVTELVEQMLPKLLHRPEPRSFVQELGSSQPVAGVQAALLAMRDRADVRGLLGNIRVPTWIMVGEHDTITPVAAAEVLRDGIPQARMNVIPGVGHLPNLEAPDAFTECVTQFLHEVR